MKISIRTMNYDEHLRLFHQQASFGNEQYANYNMKKRGFDGFHGYEEKHENEFNKNGKYFDSEHPSQRRRMDVGNHFNITNLQSEYCSMDEVNVEIMEEDNNMRSDATPHFSDNSVSPQAFPIFHNSSNSMGSSQSTISNNAAKPLGNGIIGSCWHCKKMQSVHSCQLCYRNACESSCLKYCEACNTLCCTTCTMIDYSYRYDRTLCLDCYYQKK